MLDADMGHSDWLINWGMGSSRDNWLLSGQFIVGCSQNNTFVFCTALTTSGLLIPGKYLEYHSLDYHLYWIQFGILFSVC